MNKKISAVIIIAIIIIGGLVWWAFSSNSKDTTGLPNQQVNNTQQTQPTQNESSSTSGDNSQAVVQKLLAENPNGSSTPAAMQAFTNDIIANAVKADALDVTACLPEPAVMQVSVGQTINLKNTDNQMHHLFHGKGLDKDVAAQSNQQFLIPFTEPGIYGYSCDNKINGIFFVTK